MIRLVNDEDKIKAIDKITGLWYYHRLKEDKQRDYWSERIEYEKERMKLEERKVLALERIAELLESVIVPGDTASFGYILTKHSV